MESVQTQLSPIKEALAEASQLILLGIDGVLVECEPEAHIMAHLEAVRDVFGIYVPRGDFWDVIENGMTDRHIGASLVGHAGVDTRIVQGQEVERWRERLGELYDQHVTAFDAKPELLPHVTAGLELLQNSKAAKALIASGNIRDIGVAKLEQTELDKFFPDGAGAFGDYELKRERIVKNALEMAGWLEGEKLNPVLARSAFLIGDTARDILAAKALGVRAVGITTGAEGRRELSAAGAEAVFMRFDRAVAWILDQAWYEGFTTGTL